MYFTGEGGAGGGSGGTYSSFWSPAEKNVILLKAWSSKIYKMAIPTVYSYVDHQDLGNIKHNDNKWKFTFRIRRFVW